MLHQCNVISNIMRLQAAGNAYYYKSYAVIF